MSSVITLIAFLAALVVSAYRRRVLQKERLVKMVPVDQRGSLVESILDRVSVDTRGLTREQRYDLAVRLIEGRTRRFKTLTVWVVVVAVLAATVASWAFTREAKEAQERAITAFPGQFPFQTGWIFLGYYGSFSWVEGPMVRIVYHSQDGRKAGLAGEGTTAYPIEKMFHDLPAVPGSSKRDRRLDYRDPRGEASLRQTEERIRQIGDLQRSFEDASEESIPAVGDVLRVSKARRVIIADFKTNGLANQMTFPALIKGVINENDETGLQLEPGSLVIVRDVEMGAFPGKPAAVWCRVAACDAGIPQCARALETARKSR